VLHTDVIPAEREAREPEPMTTERARAADDNSTSYILASRRNGTLYIGVTSHLVRRAYEHRIKAVPGFTKQYDVDRLVYYEIFDDAISAIGREKQLKKWRRDWKIALIEEYNPDWRDFFDSIAQWA
jgi:putative endonuclease